MSDNKKKPLVEGMYTVHRQYHPPMISDVEKKQLQAEQHQRVESKKIARKNGTLALIRT